MGKRKPRSKQERHARRKQEHEEIQALNERIEAEKPPRGTNPLAFSDANEGKKDDDEYQVYYPEAKTFQELPISAKSKTGLSDAGFKVMTDIQRATLPHSLAGRDVLAAAKTGSGKTLAFVIPILEKLFRLQWGPLDGLGALILSPTRELALQIFEVLRKVGKEHSLSAGLVIGGKELEEEQERISRMNILVATPGRLLQHLDQTPDFQCLSLEILAIDEADRILDMGFSKTLDGILQHLPDTRQTLLFSATQTKSVKHLARLSMKEPEYISVHEQSVTTTPKKLVQSVMTCELEQKVDILFSFLKSHTKCKILVFLSSCKQVRFIYESFRRLQPGLSVMELHGKMKQLKRMDVYNKFCAKTHACLFATDIAARGLDFPAVDWVVQVDCPDDVSTYIHRVGRTARYKKGGQALLLLLPSEQKMEALLKDKKIPINSIQANPKKIYSIESRMQAVLTEDPSLQYLARKAFISYMRSIYLQSNKEIFDVNALPAAAFAQSLGLHAINRLNSISTQLKAEMLPTVLTCQPSRASFLNSFPTHQSKRVDKNLPFALQAAQQETQEETAAERPTKKAKSDKVEKMMKRKNPTVLSDAYSRLRAQEEEDGDEEFLTVKQRHALEGASTRRPGGQEPTQQLLSEKQKADREAYLKSLAQQLREEDKRDKLEHAQRLREKRWALKRKLKEEAATEGQVTLAPVIGPSGEEEFGSEDEGEEQNSSSDAPPSEEEEEEDEKETIQKRGVKRKLETAATGEGTKDLDLESYALSLLRSARK